MKLGLILTNDWELFGDGSGDYFEIQHKPLYSLLDCVESHGAKLTVMAEIGQQWGHRSLGEDQPWARDVAENWDQAMRDVIRRQSDVQLHIHIQWLDSVFESEWKLRTNNISIADLSEDRIGCILRFGKTYLDNLLQPVDPEYECIAFRAGAFALQPSRVVVEKLIEAGFLCDTSVTKGLYNENLYDFRSAYSSCIPWEADPEDICTSTSRSSLFEFPIYSYGAVDSAAIRRAFGDWTYYRFTLGAAPSDTDRRWFEEKRRISYERYPKTRHLELLNDNPLRNIKKNRRIPLRWLASKIIGRRPVMLDYDGLHPELFVRCLEKAFSHPHVALYQNTDTVIPIVALGHIKNMHDTGNLSRILELAKARLGDNLTFLKLRDAVRYWKALTAQQTTSQTAKA